MNQQYLDNLIYAKESLEIWISSLKQNNSGKQIFSTGIELCSAHRSTTGLSAQRPFGGQDS